MWTAKVNAVLAAVVVTVGFWIVWGELPVAMAALLALLLAVCLAFFFCSSITAVWAWATVLLGLESLSWPIMIMWQARGLGPQPSDEAMSQILTALVGGLFSSIFWLTFSGGIFRWMKRQAEAGAGLAESKVPSAGIRSDRK
ncbi:MAG: hypothetical protein HZB35_08050 [Nitrospirae bacterium]|nr:hypothetical protein [Nitrospirota bacterium]